MKWRGGCGGARAGAQASRKQRAAERKYISGVQCAMKRVEDRKAALIERERQHEEFAAQVAHERAERAARSREGRTAVQRQLKMTRNQRREGIGGVASRRSAGVAARGRPQEPTRDDAV